MKSLICNRNDVRMVDSGFFRSGNVPAVIVHGVDWTIQV